MKKTIRALATYAGAAIMAASLASVSELTAQTTTPAPAAATQGGCTPEAKLAWYTEFRATFKTDQNKAYELAQKYLACPTAPEEENIAKYLRETFVATIDKARRPAKVSTLVYDQRDYPKAFELGKQILAEEPENLRVLIDLGYAGYPASRTGDTFKADSLTYANKAIQMLGAGKAPDVWVPYASKDEALGYLHNTIGVLTLSKDPAGALRHFLKAAQLPGKLKSDPITYSYIADAYTSGPYATLSADYNARFKDKDETPESKLALANLNQVIDRIIDAYARAVALNGTDAANQERKKVWLDTLTGYYKFRNKDSDAGLTEFIASVMSKPLPPEPTPLTTLPATTPAAPTTPVSGAMTGVGNGTAAPVVAKPAPVAASSTSTTTVKPKPKNNHSKATRKRGL